MRVRIANGDKNFASSPSPKLAVQSHEPGRESSTTFVLLLSISTYYFYKSSLSGFRITVPRGPVRKPPTVPRQNGNRAPRSYSRHVPHDGSICCFFRRRVCCLRDV